MTGMGGCPRTMYGSRSSNVLTMLSHGGIEIGTTTRGTVPSRHMPIPSLWTYKKHPFGSTNQHRGLDLPILCMRKKAYHLWLQEDLGKCFYSLKLKSGFIVRTFILGEKFQKVIVRKFELDSDQPLALAISHPCVEVNGTYSPRSTVKLFA